MTDPWLSVIVPVFNGAKTLDRTLASLPKGATGIEVILVDQSSTDCSRLIAEAYSNCLTLQIITARETSNWMQNTNIGIAAARSPLISMLHQDDLWAPDRAEELRAFLERHPDARIWTHDTWFIDELGEKLGRYVPSFARSEARMAGNAVLKHLLVQNTLAVPSVVFRRSDALESGGLDETLWYTADWDLWLRLSRLGDVAYLPKPLASFRLHSGSQTVKGSRDAADFRHQLVVPFERHITALALPDRQAVQRRAKAAVDLNICLAAAFHRQSPGWGRVLVGLFMLGPVQLGRLMRDTRIVARAMPRLRLFARRTRETT